MSLSFLPFRSLARRMRSSRWSSTLAQGFDQDVKRMLASHGTRLALRDACRCPKCVDQSSKQRDFHFAHVPTTIQGVMENNANGSVRVRWTDDIPGYDDHVSVYTPADIKRLKHLPRQDYPSINVVWDKSAFERNNRPLHYDDFMHDEAGLAKTLYMLSRFGLVFLNNVPRDEASVTTIAQRMAPLRNTFYGESWNVRSVPQAINVAYTSKYLGFHGDLLYMRETPGIQLLHCLENTCPGGESRFVDTLKAYDLLCTEQPQLAESLRKTAIRYEYDNDGSYYTDVKPVIHKKTPFEVPNRRIRGNQSAELENVSKIYWSPPFIGSVQTGPGEDSRLLKEKIEASKAFAEILERQELVYETKMDAGSCVIFNNYRVLHARNEFDLNSGSRWLKGCYLDEQDVWSKELSLGDRIRDLDSSLNSITP